MRQKLAKKIRRECYGDLSTKASARSYAWVTIQSGRAVLGRVIVADTQRGHYQRVKKEWTRRKR